jgi:hypothetical protein
MIDPKQAEEVITGGTRAEALASALARELVAEEGHAILKQARATLQGRGQRSGTNTSEYNMSRALIGAGLCMIVIGVLSGHADLQGQGVNLISVVGAGYAVSRGIAKVGASKSEPPKG